MGNSRRFAFHSSSLPNGLFAKNVPTQKGLYAVKQLCEPLDSRKLLSEAMKVAKRENKRILIQYSTSTRSEPYDQLTRFVDQNRSWEKDYLWVLNDARWKDALAVIREAEGDFKFGMPWFAILDANGAKLIGSDVTGTPNLDFDERKSIGFPVKSSEKYHFRKMLMQTKIRMTEGEIDELILALDAKSSGESNQQAIPC